MGKGAGTLYEDKNSPYWWGSYYVNGKQVRKSTKIPLDQKREAQKVLARWIAENEVPDKRSISKLLDGLIADYEHNHKKSLYTMKLVVDKHLRKHFGKKKADELKKQHITDYITMQRKTGMKNATINRHIAYLRRAYNLADAPFPRVSKLAENNVRTGFIGPEEYVRLVHHMPEHLKPIVQFAYKTGARKGEVLNLKWRDVDLENGVAILNPGQTKSGEGRVIPLTDDLVRTLQALPRHGSNVFTFRGKAIKNVRTGWANGTEAAGLPDLKFHDLRRSGIRNLVRAGVSEHVTMSISGHKTRSVFDRYNIVSERDQKEAVAKLEAAQSDLEKAAEQKLPGKMDEFMVNTEQTKKKGSAKS